MGHCGHPEQFEEQMDYVKRHRSAMPMDELVHQLSTGTLPADAVAITFDDGYRDNLVHAKAVLDSAKVSPLVYFSRPAMSIGARISGGMNSRL